MHADASPTREQVPCWVLVCQPGKHEVGRMGEVGWKLSVAAAVLPDRRQCRSSERYRGVVAGGCMSRDSESIAAGAAGWLCVGVPIDDTRND